MAQNKAIKLVKDNSVRILVISAAINILLVMYVISVSKNKATLATNITKVDSTKKDPLFEETNPINGYEINASFGDLGPKMVSMGVIDYDKFKKTYEKSGQSLPPDLDAILKQGSNKKIKITSNNAYFLLNYFWAVGLANKSPILDNGEIMKYGGIKEAGNFASTGGWSLAKGNAMDYFSKGDLIPLTQEQENLVEKVSSNVYCLNYHSQCDYTSIANS